MAKKKFGGVHHLCLLAGSITGELVHLDHMKGGPRQVTRLILHFSKHRPSGKEFITKKTSLDAVAKPDQTK